MEPCPHAGSLARVVEAGKQALRRTQRAATMRGMRQILTIAAGLAMGLWIALAGACGVIDGACSSGSNCVCKGTGLCSFDCPDGGCDLSCEGAGVCEFTCEGGGCDAVCAGQGECSLACAGGGCKLSCSGTGACTLTECIENCDVACSVGKCESSCTGPSCTKL